MIDAHNHLQDSRFDGQQTKLISTMQQVGIESCVVNGTDPSDWSRIAELVLQFPDFVKPSFGLHPWKIGTRPDDWLMQLKTCLTQFPSAGVGECGLDRWIKDYNVQDQRLVFQQQVRLAFELDRPLTIHCLKAWGQLLEVLRAESKLPRFLVHAFGGSLETANELVKLGAYFSFSGYFFYQRKKPVVEVFRNLPPDRILLETDAPYMLPPDSVQRFDAGGVDESENNHPANLAAIGKRFFELVDVSAEQVVENTNRWWSGTALVINPPIG